MSPENSTERIHDFLELTHSHIAFSRFAIIDVGLKFIEAVVYVLVLSEELQLFLECRHPLRKDGENVLFLYNLH